MTEVRKNLMSTTDSTYVTDFDPLKSKSNTQGNKDATEYKNQKLLKVDKLQQTQQIKKKQIAPVTKANTIKSNRTK